MTRYEIIRINLFLLRAIFPSKSRICSAIMEEDRLNFIVENMLMCWSIEWRGVHPYAIMKKNATIFQSFYQLAGLFAD
jgi:hypothetical protein